jgi:hypothetical protein
VDAHATDCHNPSAAVAQPNVAQQSKANHISENTPHKNPDFTNLQTQEIDYPRAHEDPDEAPLTQEEQQYTPEHSDSGTQKSHQQVEPSLLTTVHHESGRDVDTNFYQPCPAVHCKLRLPFEQLENHVSSKHPEMRPTPIASQSLLRSQIYATPVSPMSDNSTSECPDPDCDQKLYEDEIEDHVTTNHPQRNHQLAQVSHHGRSHFS